MTMEALQRRPPGRALTSAPARIIPAGTRRIIKPVGLASVAALSDSGSLRLTWPTKGRVLALFVGGYDPADGLTVEEVAARLSLQVQINGDKSLVTNGEAADFASFRSLCPGSAPWFPLDLEVRVNEPWLITVRNAAGVALTPEVCFAWSER